MLLTWAEIETACHALARDVGDGFKAVIGVPRGGWVPATILAYALDLNLYSVDNYPGSADDRFLVVDDIADTGHTMAALRPIFPNSVFAAPYAKPQGERWVNHWVIRVPQSCWVVFPFAPNDVINR